MVVETEEGVRRVGDVAARSRCAVGEGHLDGNVKSVSRVKGDIGFIDVRLGRSGVDESLKDERVVIEANVDRYVIDEWRWTN